MSDSSVLAESINEANGFDTEYTPAIDSDIAPECDTKYADEVISDYPAANKTRIESDNPFIKGFNAVSDFFFNVSAFIAYPAILVIITCDVVGRNFLHSPVAWAIEGSGLLLLSGIFLAGSKIEQDGEHIQLDALYAHYSTKGKLFLDLFARLVATGWVGIMTWRSFIEIGISIDMRETGSDFIYPYWPIRVIMTLGFLVLCIQLLLTCGSIILKFREGGRND